MTGIICGTGSYAPSYVMDNNEIATMVETSDEWIRERTGVVTRHIIKDETTVSMACEAATRALADGDVDARELDLIIVSTISSNIILPCTACEVQKELDAEHATCFDMSAACRSFRRHIQNRVDHRKRKPFQSDELEGQRYLYSIWRRCGSSSDEGWRG